MKEAEFVALLAIEGKTLEVEQNRFRWDYDWRSSKLHSCATVLGEDGLPIASSGWVQRRYYAVKSVIKRYYGDRG